MNKFTDYAKFKLSDDDRKLFQKLDKEYFNLFKEYKDITVFSNKSVNYDTEMKKFFDARKNNKKYFPVFKYERTPERVPPLRNKIYKLIEKFGKFKNCVMYKHYIAILNNMLKHLDTYLIKDYDSELLNQQHLKAEADIYLNKSYLKEAYDILKKHPYKNIENQQTLGFKELKRAINEFARKNNIKVKIKENSKQLPRISIRPDGTIMIKSDEKFSKEDIESIIQHEINGHMMQKILSCKTGLYILATQGLSSSNTYFEGLAIWQSLNLTKHPKTNVLPLIAAKYIVVCNLFELDFCELFDLYKKLLPEASDNKIFKWLTRLKKHNIYTQIPGGKYRNELDYYIGLKLVQQMTDKEREERKKYNIGPDQEYEFEDIKKFVKINRFDPIDPNNL